MVSASWLRRKSSNRSACEPRAPRWTSEMNKVRKRRSGHSSLIVQLPMREQLADFHDSVMTAHAAAGTSIIRSARWRIAAPCDNGATGACDSTSASRPRESGDPYAAAHRLGDGVVIFCNNQQAVVGS